jgi:hypothetical protein
MREYREHVGELGMHDHLVSGLRSPDAEVFPLATHSLHSHIFNILLSRFFF